MSRLAIVGYPIGHSMSPALYGAAFPVLGIDATYEAWAVEPPDLAAAIARYRSDDVLGGNVTVPHKQAVMPLLDDVDEIARKIGAVNCISKDGKGRLIGHNTDMYGFVRSLREAGCNPAGMKVLILGAGGAARSVGFGLAEAGAGMIGVSARNQERAESFAADLRMGASVRTWVGTMGWQDESFEEACEAAGLIVNTTPVGMKGTPSEGESPLPVELIRPGVWLSDLVYNPLETELLKLAVKAGARPIGGLDMLVYQAAESVRFWMGVDAPVENMKDAALERLRQQV